MEDRIVDLLLGLERVIGFTTTQVDGHSVNMQNYSVVEQVTGRQKRVQIEIMSEPEETREVLDALAEYKNSGIRYWVTDVKQAGRI